MGTSIIMLYLTFDLHVQSNINHEYILYGNFGKIANSVVRARLSIECRKTKTKPED